MNKIDNSMYYFDGPPSKDKFSFTENMKDNFEWAAELSKKLNISRKPYHIHSQNNNTQFRVEDRNNDWVATFPDKESALDFIGEDRAREERFLNAGI